MFSVNSEKMASPFAIGTMISSQAMSNHGQRGRRQRRQNCFYILTYDIHFLDIISICGRDYI